MSVRRARPGEYETLSRLQSFLAEPAPDLLAAADVVGTVFVSTAHRNRPVGYLLAVASDDGCHVAELVVHPEYRRTGRARDLLEALFDERPAESAVTVTVAAGNDAARSLYESVGFEESDCRPGYFDNDDAVVYRRTVE
ncbi:acetyltransferase [Halogeometricum borinquense DSM 11551]|uniref:Acetyltransferase n=2 Tax=Halogeometricum borinquense TaxID=60847 RepID=E4NNH8_HALBP|nr:GNAT family N-acetyltransferase [Halogeometricum borinquense]ADQ66332.1 acetyltransferase [Halogeometricum borinquense DSM 11551]ELY27678.1 acetyltransferase [Halogeometricum borinquense DSM 11551]RYJ14656.1 N-acetyltransferase [Halogeometricum borinquense]